MLKITGATEPVEQLLCILVSVFIQRTTERHGRCIMNGPKAIVLLQGISPVICEFDCQLSLRLKSYRFWVLLLYHLVLISHETSVP